MAMHVPMAPGFSQMLKEGAQHLEGMDEACYQNIEACSELAKTTRSAYGPTGQNKMIINHLEKLFVTNDAATILKELEVQHPAAKLLVMASQQQEEECGDGTNFTLMFAGALLDQAMELLRMGLCVSDVVDGYEVATCKALEILEKLVVSKVTDLHNKEELKKCIRCAVMSKQLGYEDFLAALISNACGPLIKQNNTFNVDSVRVLKIAGASVLNSTVISGLVFTREVEGVLTSMEKSKIALYSCPIDTLQTETKGTVLINTAQELMDYSKGEDHLMEESIKAIADSGVNVIVCGGKVGDLALHFINKYNLMVVRLMSKFDVRRLARTVQATALPKVVVPSPKEVGYCDHVYVDEVGETPVVVFKQDAAQSNCTTIIIRGATHNLMDDIERAIDDGVNTVKALTKDRRLLAGAGACEIELARAITQFGEMEPGLNQYSIKKFAEALECCPRALAENTGVKANELISKLYTAHQQEGGQAANMGFDIRNNEVALLNSVEESIFDLFNTKFWSLKFASTAATTVLKVDQIIMAKPAGGGPKPRDNKNWDDD